MNIIQESFQRLFPSRNFDYITEECYTRQLGDFNANVRQDGKKITVKYNLNWKNVDEEIKIGLVQTLLLKLFKTRAYEEDYSKININLYNSFVKRIPDFIEKKDSDPTLKQSFKRVNEQFFFNVLDQPSLVWGQHSTRKLASYNYHNDTVTVSKVFQESEDKILDYLMYHELLHKQLKYKNNGARNSFHTKQFREAEDIYPNKGLVEKQINSEIKKFKLSSRNKPKKSLRKNKRSLWSFFR